MKDALNHSWIDLIWGLGRVNYKKHYSLHHQSSNMEKFTFDLAIGKKLHTEQELDNAVYKIAMKVVKVTTKRLAIYHASARELCGTLLHAVQRYA